MRLLKIILKVLLALIILALIAAAFLPKEKYYGATTIINRDKSTVYEYVSSLDHQKSYSYFFLKDPNITTTAIGVDRTIGYKQTWKSKEMGDGSQEIIQLDPDSLIATKLDFGMGDPAISTIKLTELNGSTNIQYGVLMKSSYPMNLLLSIVNMDEAFEESLQNLKNILEK